MYTCPCDKQLLYNNYYSHGNGCSTNSRLLSQYYAFTCLKSNDVSVGGGGGGGGDPRVQPSMNPANLGLCPPLIQTCEKSSSFWQSTSPRYVATHARILRMKLYQIRHLLSLPRGAAYVQHIDLVFRISVAMKVCEEGVNAVLGANPQF